jgi:hypothetical protein
MKVTAQKIYRAGGYEMFFMPVSVPPFRYKVCIAKDRSVIAKDWSTERGSLRVARYFFEKHLPVLEKQGKGD